MKSDRPDEAGPSTGYMHHIDTCLGCMACVTACPSGVKYDLLLAAARPRVEQHANRPFGERAFRRLIFALFPYPGRLRWMVWPLVFYQRSGVQRLVRGTGLLKLFPARLQAMERLMPPIAVGSVGRDVPAKVLAQGVARRRVGLLLGCVQRVFFANVNMATARVLSAEGCEVIAPAEQGCCGALSMHAGEEQAAKDLARRLIDVFERCGVETVVINAAGCGSAMKEYGHLLRDDPAYAARAVAFAAKCRDISEVLGELEPQAVRHELPMRVAYHDACHLQHAQGVRLPPRKLLRSIPGLDVREIAESEICCGSAGIYNMLQPEAAGELRDRKVQNILKTMPDLIVSSNPGCLLQISTGLEQAGRPIPTAHLVEVLDAAITGNRRWTRCHGPKSPRDRVPD
jgi:glycolate oxidase iron-sulfur subunit